MFSTLSERVMHWIRWGLAIAWFILIASLFYDPISAQLTTPDALFAASIPEGCFQFQGECRPVSTYPMGARIFWGMVVPLSILILFIFGHETWRRICPLSFVSQIPRALGWQQKRIVSETSWLGRHALSVQWILLFIGLNLRLLFVNSDRYLLGIFLLLTIFLAITIGFLYDGKSWCNYFCPMAPVQMIYSEPSGLLGSQAHTAPPKTITQSMCRTLNSSGQEKTACVACKTSCIDIDAEGNYWDNIRRADRKLLYYSYVGLVIGFYLYFWLYSGNGSFLSTGVWQETNQFATLLNPGFYIGGKAIAIPKLIAVPLTLTTSAGVTYAIGLWVEHRLKRLNRRLGYPLSADHIQSRLFAIATFIAFNLVFFLGIRPTVGYLPVPMQHGFSWVAIVVSSFWLAKTWRRSAHRYHRERDANMLRRQLNKLSTDFYQILEGRSLDDLNADELYMLARALPDFSQNYRQHLYQEVLRDALRDRSITPDASFKALQSLRQSLGLSEAVHLTALETLQLEEPLLFPTSKSLTKRSPIDRPDPDTKLRRQVSNPSASDETTIYRPSDSAKPSDTPPTSDETTVYKAGHSAKPSDSAKAGHSGADDATVYRQPDSL